MAQAFWIDHGWRRIVQGLNNLERARLEVGLWPGTMQDGVDVAAYGEFNEFGTSRIPARPFMRFTADTKFNALLAFQAKQLVALYTQGLSPRGLMANLGGWYVDALQTTISNSPSWAVPNSPSTVAQKGFNHPLIDQSVLTRTLTYTIR